MSSSQKNNPQLKALNEAVNEHGAEGIEILSAQPSKLVRSMILLIAALIVAGLLWSFIGHADVIVSAQGRLAPDSDVQRFYTPIDGELVDIYVAEGQPVTKGDTLARLNARQAIEIAANALEAELQLSNAERDSERFKQRQQLLQREIESLERQIEIARNLHEKRLAEGLVKITQAQKARLEEAKANQQKAGRALEVTRKDLAKLERLFNLDGGGGVSRDQVEQARSKLIVAQADFNLSKASLNELEYQLSNEYAEAKAKVEGSDRDLVALEIERDKKREALIQEQQRIELQLKKAQIGANLASRINFGNIDADNFLRIEAPVSGTVTEVTYTQAGDKLNANTPLGGIAASDAQPVLKLEIAEADRAFLRVGQEVKIKFNAFPYQRYGFIEGELEYVSPTTQSAAGTGAFVYKGRVALDKDFFEVDGERLSLRYGMEGIAEIVVRKRRIFDLILDPLRNLQG